MAFYYRIALPETHQGIGRCQDSQDSCAKRERSRTFWREQRLACSQTCRTAAHVMAGTLAYPRLLIHHTGF
jgi:hypothetical protein